MKLGIIGGGQLGRMLALAAHRLAIEPLVLDPDPLCPAAAVAGLVPGDYDDPAALERLGRCDAVTFEFENAPLDPLRRLAQHIGVHPTPVALELTRDRLREKRFFGQLSVPTPRHRGVSSLAELRSAVREIGTPAILKTRRFGYDGKGQVALGRKTDLEDAWNRLGGAPAILEERVDFDREISLLAVRGRDGSLRFWPPSENRHREGILRISRAPARNVDPQALRRARGWLEDMMVELDYVGVLCIEFFVRDGEWLLNEAACRVHNSGHWSIEASETSQFENHVRAVLGLPLGETRSREPAAMLNLIGEMPPRAALLAVPGLHLHDYAKSPLPGRKLGHVTLTAPTADELEQRLAALSGPLPGAVEEPAWVPAPAA